MELCKFLVNFEGAFQAPMVLKLCVFYVRISVKK